MCASLPAPTARCRVWPVLSIRSGRTSVPPEPRSMSALDLPDGVERREVVGHRQAAGRRDLQKCVAEVALTRKAAALERRVEGAVAIEEIDVAGRVGMPGPAPAIQRPPLDPFGVTFRTLACARVEALYAIDPSGIGIDVAVRRPRCDDLAVQQHAGRPAPRIASDRRARRRPSCRRQFPETTPTIVIGPPSSSAPVVTSSACSR